MVIDEISRSAVLIVVSYVVGGHSRGRIGSESVDPR